MAKPSTSKPINIVVPMAGRGARFAEAGYTVPKPLIPVHGIPMVQVVVNNLRPSYDHRFVFVCQNEHLQNYDLAKQLKSVAPSCQIIGISGVTAGAACTVLLAREFFDDECPLMIANCDQWIHFSIDEYLEAFDRDKYSGFIMTMRSDSPKWSYVERSETDEVCGVVEKQVVSDEATVGIYNFASGRDFVRHTEQMILDNDRSKGEFYVAPVYTRLINDGKKIGTLSIGSDVEGMYGLGTPADLDRFLNLGFAEKLAAEASLTKRAA